MEQSDSILTVQEAAKLLKVRPDTVYAWLKAGKIPGRLIGGEGGVWRLQRKALEEFCAGDNSEFQGYSQQTAPLPHLELVDTRSMRRHAASSDGLRYWGWRTHNWENKRDASVLFDELRAGRLRNGWGSLPSQDLRLIDEKWRGGQPLDSEERLAWKGRLMLIGVFEEGVRPNDIIFVLNLPGDRELCLARVAQGAEYSFEPLQNAQWPQPDYGHLLPVELLTQDPIDLASHPALSPELRNALRPRNRVFRIYSSGTVEPFLAALGISP